MYSLLTDPRLRDIQLEYVDFLEREDYPDPNYRQRIMSMLEGNEWRLVIDIGHLRVIVPQRAKSLLLNACEELLCLQQALKRVATSLDPSLAEKDIEAFNVGISGALGEFQLNPRTLLSCYLGNLVCVEGIVTRCSLVCPKLVKSVHYCPTTRKVIQKFHGDASSSHSLPGFVVYPTKDDEGNLYETEYGLCQYQDYQTFIIQEMPENAPPGQLPRSVSVVVESDLVDRCKTGDRVRVTGIYQCIPQRNAQITSAFFRSSLAANNISHVNNDLSEQLEPNDVKMIRSFARRYRHDVFNILARSLAPSIQGHENVKKAILCMVLGGTEKNLQNGTRLRGDINLMLIGDPSVAKSQLLRYVLHVAPIAVCTTGRGSSGVGLTATVTTDQDTGERRLEGGAMVIADRGVVCIDEFDKMTDIDRTAIHEVLCGSTFQIIELLSPQGKYSRMFNLSYVIYSNLVGLIKGLLFRTLMEQGRVTIAKAGVHATLNARCSVLAAANPIYGRYDIYRTPMENIGLPDSLLSRFDVIFIMLDKVRPEVDKRVAEHVLKIHLYRPLVSAGLLPDTKQEGRKTHPQNTDLPIYAVDRTRIAHAVSDSWFGSGAAVGDTPEVEHGDTAPSEEDLIFEKDDVMVDPSARGKNKKIVQVEFFKKYVKLARSMKPALSKQAAEIITKEFVRLRNYHTSSGVQQVARTQPITVRTLETLIRISTAFAKSRLSRQVSASDAQSAVQLVREAIFEEVASKPKRKKPNDGPSEWHPFGEGNVDGPQDSDGIENGTKRIRREEVPIDINELVCETETFDISDHVRSEFRVALADHFRFGRHQSLTIAEIVANIKSLEERREVQQLDERQIRWMLQQMEEEGMLMLSNDKVFLI
ncbi:hypothetical protein ACOME3_009706 [Neoechinorhynchus agilis]